MRQIAHRGYSDRYPENTMKAFKEAIKAGFDGIETDVHRTSDGKLVLCHDEKIDRTSNGEGYIKDMTYSQLCKYNFNYKFKEENEKIPLLVELLELVKGTELILDIEVKTDKIHYSGIEKDIYELVKSMDMLNQIIFSSFYLESLIELEKLDGSLYLGYLWENDYDQKVQLAYDHHYHCHPDESLLDEEKIEDIKKHHLDLNVWTVKNRYRQEYLKEHGVNMTISNKRFKEVVIVD